MTTPMSTKTNMVIFYVLLGLTLAVWARMTARLFAQPTSGHDAIGEGIVTVLIMLPLWGLLLVLLWMGGAREQMPKWAKVLAWILHPASFAAAVAVQDRANNPNGSWLIVVPVV